jgi:hypothetical protein
MQPYFSEIPRMHPDYLLFLDIKISMKKWFKFEQLMHCAYLNITKPPWSNLTHQGFSNNTKNTMSSAMI